MFHWVLKTSEATKESIWRTILSRFCFVKMAKRMEIKVVDWNWTQIIPDKVDQRPAASDSKDLFPELFHFDSR